MTKKATHASIAMPESRSDRFCSTKEDVDSRPQMRCICSVHVVRCGEAVLLSEQSLSLLLYITICQKEERPQCDIRLERR